MSPASAASAAPEEADIDAACWSSQSAIAPRPTIDRTPKRCIRAAAPRRARDAGAGPPAAAPSVSYPLAEPRAQARFRRGRRRRQCDRVVGEEFEKRVAHAIERRGVREGPLRVDERLKIGGDFLLRRDEGGEDQTGNAESHSSHSDVSRTTLDAARSPDPHATPSARI